MATPTKTATCPACGKVAIFTLCGIQFDRVVLYNCTRCGSTRSEESLIPIEKAA